MTEDSLRSRLLKASPLPPTKSIVFSNQKGGVGKTTTLLSCAWLASELDTRPSLVIDLCPQGNASHTLFGPEYVAQESTTSFDLLMGNEWEGRPLECAGNIELIPASPYLFDVDNSQTETVQAHFKQSVQRLAATNQYSWIFIDTPPSVGALQLAPLAAADYSLIPIRLDSFSMQGLKGILDAVGIVHEQFDSQVSILGVLPNMVNAARKEQIGALKELVGQLGDAVLGIPLRDRAPIADALDQRQAVWKNIRSGNARAAALEMRAVISDILRRAR